MLQPIDVFHVNGVKAVNIYNKSPIAFFGIFCLNGYVFEPTNKYGIAHFAEHMFFKGTSKRTWKQINMDFAKIGSNANAYTSSDEVCYFVTTMNDQLEKSAEILTDMFFNSNYDSLEIEKERNVITEEKKMYDDDPSSDFANKCGRLLNPSYGHDAIGSIESIAAITRDDLTGYLTKTLGLGNIMVVFCGDMSTEALRAILEKLIPQSHQFTWNSSRNTNSEPLWNPSYAGGDKIKFVYERANTEQAQITGVMGGLSAFDAMKYEEILALACFGGGDYSMMFERLREELGLCYSLGVGNEIVSYPHVSVTRIFGLTEPKDVYKFIDETDKLCLKIRKDGIDPSLFECAKNSVASAILRSVETSRGKAGFLLKRVLFDRGITAEEFVDGIRKVSLKNCTDVANEVLQPDKFKWAVMVEKKEDLG